jgi:FSR family fosmidomycin resistance protein-like MFS transporter
VVHTQGELSEVETPRPAPAHAIRLIAVTSLAHFVNDGVIFFVPVIGDLLAHQDHTSPAVLTAMLTVFYVVSAGFGLGVGLVSDALGRRGMMIALGIASLGLSLFAFYVALSLHGAASDVFVITAAVVAGFGSAFYHPLGASVLQLNFADASRGRALGINGAFGSLGRTVYPALFFVVAALGLTKMDTTAVFGGLSLLAAAGIAYGLRARVTGERTGLAKVEASALSGNAGRDGPDDGANDPAAVPTPLERETLGDLLNRSMVALMVIAFFRSMAFIGIVSWVPIYLTTQRHAGVSGTLGVAVTVMYAGGIVGQPVFGLLADRFDKRLVLAVDSLGSAAGIFAFLGTSGHGAGALLSLALFGFFTFASFPLLLSLVADYVPKERSTTGNALVWGVGSTGGQALGPVAASLLMLGSYSHLGLAFGVLGGLAAATVLGTPLLARTPRRARMALFG